MYPYFAYPPPSEGTHGDANSPNGVAPGPPYMMSYLPPHGMVYYPPQPGQGAFYYNNRWRLTSKFQSRFCHCASHRTSSTYQTRKTEASEDGRESQFSLYLFFVLTVDSARVVLPRVEAAMTYALQTMFEMWSRRVLHRRSAKGAEERCGAWAVQARTVQAQKSAEVRRPCFI